jgi:hypothetical protein
MGITFDLTIIFIFQGMEEVSDHSPVFKIKDDVTKLVHQVFKVNKLDFGSLEVIDLPLLIFRVRRICNVGVRYLVILDLL